jgi:hypothetical protein
MKICDEKIDNNEQVLHFANFKRLLDPKAMANRVSPAQVDDAVNTPIENLLDHY